MIEHQPTDEEVRGPNGQPHPSEAAPHQESIGGGYVAWLLIPLVLSSELGGRAKGILVAALGATPLVTKILTIALFGSADAELPKEEVWFIWRPHRPRRLNRASTEQKYRTQDYDAAPLRSASEINRTRIATAWAEAAQITEVLSFRR